jgi:hypothetical protein
MKRHSFILLLFLLQGSYTFGQDSIEAMPNINLAVIAQEHHGNSYITAPTDIGNIEPLWFEANMIPNFNIRSNKNSRLLGVLTPQIILRMYQEESSPVRTPSYIPQLTVYYKLKKKNKACSLNIFGKIAHHSNGQDGPFYLDNGEINYHTASFSTNYVEIGLIKTRFSEQFNAVQFFSSSIEIHPLGLTIEELHGQYPMYKWNNIFSIFKLPETSTREKKTHFSIRGEFSYIMGDYKNLNAIDFERINLGITLFYHPKLLEEIGFFVQFYQGADYYNIYFDHQRTMLRFGIMTDKLRF